MIELDVDVTIEDVIEGINKAIESLHPKPTIVVKDGNVVGIKLNSGAIETLCRMSLEGDEDKIPGYMYEGVKVYRDDTITRPQYIIEGEVKCKTYLRWEDLKFEFKSKSMPVRMGDNVYKMTYRISLGLNEGWVTIEDCQRIYLDVFENEKKFFNDLHLEVIEDE